MSYETIRTETDGHVRHIVLARPKAFNAITATFRDELEQAINAAEEDKSIRVILLRAEGKTFCAGFGLDWSPPEQLKREKGGQDYRSHMVDDLQRIGGFAKVFSKLRECSKPTVGAIQGYCIAGGTDLALNCDLLICGETASFGYPPSRVWGVPEQPWLWVRRIGAQAARRYILTGDEIPAAEALRLGLVWQVVPDDTLRDQAKALADRIAMVPRNQLQMLKLVLNDVDNHQFAPGSSRMLGCMFDGVARHTTEGRAFVDRAMEVGWREVIRERDGPFGDYGEKPKT